MGAGCSVEAFVNVATTDEVRYAVRSIETWQKSQETAKLSGMQTSVTHGTLLVRLGGTDVVKRVVEAFYRKLYADSRLIIFLHDKEMTYLRAKQSAFMSWLFGPPNVPYMGRSVRIAHLRIIKQRGFSPEDFELGMKYFQDGMRELGASDAIIKEVMLKVWPFKDAIFTPSARDPEEEARWAVEERVHQQEEEVKHAAVNHGHSHLSGLHHNSSQVATALAAAAAHAHSHAPHSSGQVSIRVGSSGQAALPGLTSSGQVSIGLGNSSGQTSSFRGPQCPFTGGRGSRPVSPAAIAAAAAAAADAAAAVAAEASPSPPAAAVPALLLPKGSRPTSAAPPAAQPSDAATVAAPVSPTVMTARKMGLVEEATTPASPAAASNPPRSSPRAASSGSRPASASCPFHNAAAASAAAAATPGAEPKRLPSPKVKAVAAAASSPAAPSPAAAGTAVAVAEAEEEDVVKAFLSEMAEEEARAMSGRSSP